MNGGLNYVSNAFRFDLKSISDNQHPDFFTFPENNHQYGLGMYVGLGVSYAFYRDYSLRLSLDYSDVKNNDEENLLGSRVGLALNWAI